MATLEFFLYHIFHCHHYFSGNLNISMFYSFIFTTSLPTNENLRYTYSYYKARAVKVAAPCID